MERRETLFGLFVATLRFLRTKGTRVWGVLSSATNETQRLLKALGFFPPILACYDPFLRILVNPAEQNISKFNGFSKNYFCTLENQFNLGSSTKPPLQ
jgi:hypothetical protein